MNRVLPNRLAPQSRLAIVSPSTAAAAEYPRRFDRGRQFLESLGFYVDVMPNARKHATGAPTLTVEERVDDLHAAFADSSISGIVSAIGGTGAAQLLESLDYDLIRDNPKVFCGYSDTTALHSAIGSLTGLVTFYGPSVLAEFAEYPSAQPETVSHFLAVATIASPSGVTPTFGKIITESPDWASDIATTPEPVPPSIWVREGVAQGPLSGGCLPVLTQLLGTPYAPNVRGTILAIETPPGYSPTELTQDLWHLRNAGWFADIHGLVLAWPNPMDRVEPFLSAVRRTTLPYTWPILVGAPFGHTSPRLTLPLGCAAELSLEGLTVLEAAVADL